MTMIEDTDNINQTATVEEQPDDPKVLMRQAREMIPVGRGGVVPQDFAQQVDYARDMAKATIALPAHLRGSVGDCLAIVDIASRAGLSPYMVANKTYVQAGRLSFESQLYHAFAQASGLLKGDLIVDYEGDGDDLVCIVSGYLRVDPHVKRVHRSPRLADRHPGRTEKDGKTFVRGSPLWDVKPRVQLFYDTSRDWVRIYCPRATLGIYTPDEIEEYGPDFARDVTPIAPASALAERLAKAAEEGTGSGFHPDVVEDGLNEEQPVIPQAADVFGNRNFGSPQAVRAGRGRAKAAKPSRTPVKGKTAPAATPAPAKRVSGKNAPVPTIEQFRESAKLADAEPKTVKEYGLWLTAWLRSETDPEAVKTRWSRERALRNRCNLTQEDREPLQLMIKERLEQLS